MKITLYYLLILDILQLEKCLVKLMLLFACASSGERSSEISRECSVCDLQNKSTVVKSVDVKSPWREKTLNPTQCCFFIA